MRIVLPPTSDLEKAALAKRPTVAEDETVSVAFSHKFKDKSEYAEEHKVSVVYWPEGRPDAATEVARVR